MMCLKLLFSTTQCIASIVVPQVSFIIAFSGLTSPHKVGRMMMNIRGLIMDDPVHTTHLQTLEFATWTNAGSEIEERTSGDV
jgi:hypothetical protein